MPPVFRLHATPLGQALPQPASIETVRAGGATQAFAMADRGLYLESTQDVPEPHEFVAHVSVGGVRHSVQFTEHAHGAVGRDNNMRAALVHVLADAAVSVLVIAGLAMARLFGWLWMDPLAGLVGAAVIANWSYGLVRDTGAILLDMSPDRGMADAVRRAIEIEGDRLADLHIWRLGPGHLGAILSIVTRRPQPAQAYRARLGALRALSHVTIEIQQAGEAAPSA